MSLLCPVGEGGTILHSAWISGIKEMAIGEAKGYSGFGMPIAVQYRPFAMDGLGGKSWPAVGLSLFKLCIFLLGREFWLCTLPILGMWDDQTKTSLH